MNRKVVMVIDLGTTGTRVVAISKEGAIVFKSYYEFSQIFPQPGWVEQDPIEIISTTNQALRDVLSFIGAENVISIGITSQRETTILWDKQSGKPVYNAIVWQDRRTEKICEELKNYKTLIKRKTGLFLDPYFSATKIKWIFGNIDGVKEMAQKGTLFFGTPDVWLLWNLTQGKVFATEPSNASRTLLFNIDSLEFDDELLKIFDIPAGILPQVEDSDSVFGYTDKRITGREIPIVGILGDQQASLFAHRGWEEGIVKNTYGTGLFVMSNTQNTILKSEKLLNTASWRLKGKVNYAIEGSIFMGGAVIQWLRDNLKILRAASDSEQMAESTKDNEGVYFVPALQGLGAPFWKPNARGMIVGLTRKTSRETIVRAALESLAYQTRDVIEEMEKELGIKFKILRVDGGACLNNFLMQFQSDILGLTVERPKIIETTALGAAGISGVASGFWTLDEFKDFMKIDRTFEASMDVDKREVYYNEWREAIKQTLIYSKL